MISGFRVLVVENEAVVASDIAEMIKDAEGAVIGPFSSVQEARALLKEKVPVDAAVLDVNLKDGTITPVLESLRARGIPTVVYTGGTVPDDVRRRHPDLVSLSKPVRPARLIAELRRASGKLVA